MEALKPRGFGAQKTKFFVSFLAITALNLVGLGTLAFIYRPILWGLIYAPTRPHAVMLLIAIIPTLILEGIAYVIAFTTNIDLILAIAKPKSMEKKADLKHGYTI